MKELEPELLQSIVPNPLLHHISDKLCIGDCVSIDEVYQNNYFRGGATPHLHFAKRTGSAKTQKWSRDV